MSGRKLGCAKVGVDLLVFVAYGALACITTWPLIARMTTHLTGNSTDSLLHYWNGWWVRQALASGRSPLYTPYLFYPNGARLMTHNIAWLNVLPWLALEPLLGGILAYNAIVLFGLALCGYCAFTLSRELTSDPRAAFVAGFIYQAWPYRISQIDYINLVSTQWIPLFFLFLIRAIRRGRWRDSVLCGMLFGLMGYTRWQLLIPVTLMGLTYFVGSAPRWLPKGRRYVIARLLVAAGVAVVTLLLPVSLLLGQLRSESSPGDLIYRGDEERMQADLLAYLTPGPSHPALGRYTRSLYDRYYSSRESNRRYPAYVGLVALGLALLGVKFRGRKSLPWLLVALVLVSLALGPILRLNGRLEPKVPTLYRLLSPLVFVRWVRIPERFNLFLALPVSVLAAWGAMACLAREPGLKRWRSALFLCLACAAILFEYLAVPIALYRHGSYATSFYKQMASEEGEFAVLNLPFNVNEAKGYMFDQTLHLRPILQGNLSRTYEKLYSYINGNPWLRVLRQSDEMPPYLTDVSRQLAILNRDGVRYIVLHKTWVGSDRIAHWQQYLLAEPCYRDSRVIIYRTAPEAGRDYALKEELIPGLGPIDLLVSADCLTLGHVLEVDVGWGSTEPIGRDLGVALSLVDSAGRVRQTERFPISAGWPTSQWPAHSIAWGYYALRLSPSLPEGEYALTLTLLDPETGRSLGHPMRVRSMAIQADVCNLATEPEARDVNALFGDVLRLQEYESSQKGGWLNLTLYWHSERRMDSDYKVFVHVADPATGIPVAQDDAMPRHNAYPTTFWWPGETVEDHISIPLHGVPAGQYDIAIGLYEPLTGERLPLRDSRGQLVEDGRLVLDEQVVQ